MKIIEAINAVDSHLPNSYTQSDKVGWLSTLDAMVKAEIIDTHEGGDEVNFDGYDQNTDPGTVLLVSAPHDLIYLRWLEAQIHYRNGENDKHNDAITAFNTAYGGFRNFYNRKHMPKGEKIKFF